MAPKPRLYKEKPCKHCGEMFGPDRRTELGREHHFNWGNWDRSQCCSLACRNRATKNCSDPRCTDNHKTIMVNGIPPCPTFLHSVRENTKRINRIRYATDAAYRERQGLGAKERYDADPESWSYRSARNALRRRITTKNARISEMESQLEALNA